VSRLISIVRKVARGWSIASLLLIILFFSGERSAAFQMGLREWLGVLFFPLGVSGGMVIAWRREALGGLITLFSLLGFYFIYGYWLSGTFPQGWMFFAFSAPGLLFLVCWLLSRVFSRSLRT
jgi:hypothetical protein